MSEPSVHRIGGHIILVQEGRFQLACDDRSTRLFILSPAASVEASDIETLLRDDPHVVVAYKPAPSLHALTAVAVTRSANHQPERRPNDPL